MFKYTKFILTAIVAICSLPGCGESDQPVANPDDMIPMPESYSVGEGYYTLRNGFGIGCEDERYLDAAQYFAGIMHSFSPTIGAYGNDVKFVHDDALTADAYQLDISRDGIELKAGGYGGMISAVASLRQLLPADVSAGGKARLASVSITDAPRLGWRGFMLDCSRHFWTKEEVLQILDLMALYKLNKFHWHLTDDQGWRIEIKRYPELTLNGAWRDPQTHNNDLECLRRAETEFNDDYLLPADRFSEIGGKSLYGGYYTQDDIRKVVAYARRLGIDVIPEIDMPGHSLQAIDNYPELSCFGKPEWGEVFSTPLCPGKDGTLDFCRNVWSEVLELFPYEYVNLGADEVEKHNWKKCPHCQNRMRRNGLKTENELQSWFVREMQRFFTENGRKMIGWDEILDGGASSDATVLWWRAWVKDVPQRAAANGNHIIVCPTEWLYLDNSQSRISLNKTYNFEPVPASFDAEQQEYVLGVQGNVWCEYIPTIQRVHYQMFPRFFALSEMGWVQHGKKDEADFNRRVLSHYPRLDAMGVGYRVPDLTGVYDRNVFTDTARIAISCPHPDITIRWAADGTIPDAESPVYDGELIITESCEMIFRAFRPDGSAADITHAPYIKSDYTGSVQGLIIAVGGLHADWYDYRGESCTEIDKSRYKGRYSVDNVTIPDGVSGNIGLIFRGYIDVPADGIYTFWLNSDDGSMLVINGDTVIDNDGPHSMREKTGQAALRAGLHPMEVRYFDSNGGGLSMGLVDGNGERTMMDKSWFKCGAL